MCDECGCIKNLDAQHEAEDNARVSESRLNDWLCATCGNWGWTNKDVNGNKTMGICTIARTLPADLPEGWLTDDDFGCRFHTGI